VSAGALKRSALESFVDDERLMEQDILQKNEKDVLLKFDSQNDFSKLISDDLPEKSTRFVLRWNRTIPYGRYLSSFDTVF